jgi:membrane protease YdiL (CAAX protease family)
MDEMDEPTPEPGGSGREPKATGNGSSNPAPVATALVRSAAVFYAVLFAVAWAGSALTAEPLMYASIAAAERGVAPLRDPGLGLVAALVVILLSDRLTHLTAAGTALARALGSLIGRLTWVQCIALALMSGVAEEAFFRGALQPRVGIAAASLLFGLAHWVPRRDLWPWSVFAVSVGFLLGTLFDATGNLIAPTIAHVGINAVNLHLLSQRYGGQ